MIFGDFSQKKGEIFSILKPSVNLPSNVVCQNHSKVLKDVLQKGGMISDQFDHVKVIGYCVSEKGEKREVL